MGALYNEGCMGWWAGCRYVRDGGRDVGILRDGGRDVGAQRAGIGRLTCMRSDMSL